MNINLIRVIIITIFIIISIIIFVNRNIFTNKVIYYLQQNNQKEIKDIISNKLNFKVIAYNSDIPSYLKDKMIIIQNNIKYNSKNKVLFIKDILNSIKLLGSKFKINNVSIIDFLDYYQTYNLGPHTDIEWNAIENDGYQVWSLINNQNPRGNIFFVYNSYLYNKYKDTPYYIDKVKDQILIIENCKFSSLVKKVLEKISVKQFIQDTKIYYINIPNGHTIVFNKNICHMSDTIMTNKRYAINFRIVYNKPKFKKNNCGYIHKKNEVVYF